MGDGREASVRPRCARGRLAGSSPLLVNRRSVRRRLVFAKRCDQVVDKGSCLWLGGSAAGGDGVELGGSPLPIPQKTNIVSPSSFHRVPPHRTPAVTQAIDP